MRFVKYALILGLIVTIFFVAGQYASEPYIKLSGETMGTYYNIKIRSSRDKVVIDSAVKQELTAINNQMSVFKSDSEISKINQAPINEWIELSPEMSEVLQTSDKIYRRSHGSFDPSVGALVELWGFGGSHNQTVPDEQAIKEALEVTGFDKIRFSKDYKRIKKLKPGVYLNLSAIAKGYGVDRIAELLLSQGLQDFVVEIGGEVRAHGNRSEDSNGWRIGILKPDTRQDGNKFPLVAKLNNAAVATSGDYENYFLVGNKKYSHTISPSTGYPISNNINSVTVFAKKCINADAYATAIMSMGEEKGLKFANDYKLPVIMYIRTDDGDLRSIITEEAKKYIEEQANEPHKS